MIPISSSLSAMFNAQIGREIRNGLLYRAFGSWAHVRGLERVAKFFNGEADGEHKHAEMLMDVLDKANVQIAFPEITATPSAFADCAQIIDLYAAAEVETTDALDEIYRAAESEGNVAVSNFVQGMLEEQIEEQGLTERVRAALDASGRNLALFDMLVERLKQSTTPR